MAIIRTILYKVGYLGMSSFKQTKQTVLIFRCLWACTNLTQIAKPRQTLSIIFCKKWNTNFFRPWTKERRDTMQTFFTTKKFFPRLCSKYQHLFFARHYSKNKPILLNQVSTKFDLIAHKGLFKSAMSFLWFVNLLIYIILIKDTAELINHLYLLINKHHLIMFNNLN